MRKVKAKTLISFLAFASS